MSYSQNPPIDTNKNGKISIASLDDDVTVVAQYNPKELSIDRSVPWSPVSQANQSNANGIHLEFTGAQGRTISVELLFDGYEKKQSIAPQVQALEKLASVIDPTSPSEDKRRPRRCVATWGSTLGSFRCVISQLTTKYTMFGADGTPLRATCTVSLMEADVVSMGKGGSGGAGG